MRQEEYSSATWGKIIEYMEMWRSFPKIQKDSYNSARVTGDVVKRKLIIDLAGLSQWEHQDRMKGSTEKQAELVAC